MDTECLKYFFTIAEGSTFFNAAEKHNISQSSLSKALQRLEAELNVDLFERSGRSVRLTPAGKCLHVGLKEMLPIYSKLIDTIRRHAKVINCWVIPSITVLRLQHMIDKFKKLHPQIAIDLVGNNDPFEVFKAMEEGKIDLLFVNQSLVDQEHYNVTALRDDHLLAVLPVNHPLSGSESIRFADLRNENIILNKWKIEALKGYFESLDFMPKIIRTSFGRESVFADVASGVGVALYYSTDINFYKLSDITFCRVEDAPHNPRVIATSKTLKLSDAHNQLIQFLVNSISKGS